VRALPAALVLLALLSAGAPTAAASEPSVRAIVSLSDTESLPFPPGVTVLHSYDAFRGVLVTAPPAVLSGLRTWPGVLGVYPDEPLERHLDLSRPVLGLAEGQGVRETGRGVTVAVVDSGIDPSHPGLSGRVRAYAVTEAGVTEARTSQDASAHGTHVAGALAGNGAQSPGERYRGIAPEATLVALDLGSGFTVDTALRAFDWLHANHRQHDIRIVTNSWGRSGGVDGKFDPSAPLVRAANTLALEDGLLVVFSAGNRGKVSSLSSEALNPNVLTVGAVDAGGIPADFSSRGPGLTAAGTPLSWTKPDLVAVGDGVVSARGGLNPAALTTEDRSLAPAYYMEQSGTSIAAPMVAGAAALLLEANPGLTREQLMGILIATARDLAAPGPDPVTGAGLLDVGPALALAREGALPGGAATRTVATAFPADLVVMQGIVTKTGPSPGVSVGKEFVGYLPVLPGTPRLTATASWSSTLPASFTARLLRPDGSEAGALKGTGNALTLSVAAPPPGVWEVRVKPGANGVYQASLEMGGTADMLRDVPAITSLDALPVPGGAIALSEAPAPNDTPAASLLAVIAVLVLLARARRYK